jgi:hypothetical protein
MPEIFVSRDPEQPGARFEAGRQLEIREIGEAVAAAQPILLLGQIVVADAGAMELAQCSLGGTEIADIAMGFRQMQRHTIDEAAHQRLIAGPQQFWPDLQTPRLYQRAALAREQMAGREIGPPRDLVEPTQHRIDFAGAVAEAAALDRGKHVAL